MKLIAYIRVSRVGGRAGESFISPDVQRQKIAAYAKARGWRISTWYEELDQPGSRYDRPKFQQALERVEAGKADGIIVAKLDRFARSVVDAHTAIRRLQAADGQLVSVEDSFDTSTPMGKFAVTVILAMAELELDRIRANWGDAQARAVARGAHAAPAPLGYRKRRDGVLEPDPVTAPVVRAMFKRRGKGQTLTALAEYLNASGVLPRGRLWTSTPLAKLLASRTYLGEARGGGHVNATAHEPLVTAEVWQAAQSGKQKAARNGSNGHQLLSGLIRCAGCSYAMSPTTTKNHRGDTIRLYACTRKHSGGVCQSPAAVSASVIEPWVEQVFLDQAAGEPGVHGESTGDELREAQARVALAEQDLIAFLDPATTVGVEPALIREAIEARQRLLDEARADLDDVSEHAEHGSLIADLDLSAWPTLSVAERRRLLAPTLDAVMVWRGRVPIADRALILWRGEGPADLPSRGRRSTVTPYRRPREVGAQVGSEVE